MSQRWGSRIGSILSGGLLLGVCAVAALSMYQFKSTWTPLQRYWLPAYLKMHVAAYFQLPTTEYRMLAINNGKQWRLAVDEDVVELESASQGKVPLAITDELYKQGFRLIIERPKMYNTGPMKSFVGHWIYKDQSLTELMKVPLWGGLGVFVAVLLIGIPLEQKRQRRLREGRRLRGPELLTTTEFNRRLNSDGLAFLNEKRTWKERLFARESSRWVRLPRVLEPKHLLLAGDTGGGKSSLIRQTLAQVEQRGETAIVYDPGQEYLSQFYRPERGDVVLNPLDERMPYWSPADEVQDKAEATTLAAALFPEHPHDPNYFFVDSCRKVFAKLLLLKPTPQELVEWLCHEEEIDRRVKGTELASMVHVGGGGDQRAGVLGSLGMVADSLRLLPGEEEKRKRWTVTEWSKHRKGWLFLTGEPDHREALRPLMSVWLDMLILRLMRPGSRRVWLVMDELGSLHKLPQLETAVMENRKYDNPLVLGFQGRGHLKAIYGKETAETMLSQPATKIFLRTSEADAADWISRTIGEVEIERLRETRTNEQFPRDRRSESLAMDRQIQRLVLASEIEGLEDRRGYLKTGNFVLPLAFPYINLPEVHEKFIPRKVREYKESSLAADPSSDSVQDKACAAAAGRERPFFE